MPADHEHEVQFMPKVLSLKGYKMEQASEADVRAALINANEVDGSFTFVSMEFVNGFYIAKFEK